MRQRLEPLADLLRPQEATPGSEPSWFGCLLTLTDDARFAGFSRDGIVARLEAARVQTRMLFAGNVERQPCFDPLRAAAKAGGKASYRVVGELAVSDHLMTDAFWVGVYPGLSDDMVEYIGDQIAAACGR